MCVRAFVCACMRACVRARDNACVRACVRACRLCVGMVCMYTLLVYMQSSKIHLPATNGFVIGQVKLVVLVGYLCVVIIQRIGNLQNYK